MRLWSATKLTEEFKFCSAFRLACCAPNGNVSFWPEPCLSQDRSRLVRAERGARGLTLEEADSSNSSAACRMMLSCFARVLLLVRSAWLSG